MKLHDSDKVKYKLFNNCCKVQAVKMHTIFCLIKIYSLCNYFAVFNQFY